MKKIVTGLLVCLLAVSILGGCGKKEQSPTETTAPSPTEKKVVDCQAEVIAVHPAEDYKTDPVAVVTYRVTNLGDTDMTYGFHLSAKATQQGKDCEAALFLDEIEEYTTDSQFVTIKPGESREVMEAYSLVNKTAPVDIVLTNRTNGKTVFSGTVKVTG